MAVCCTFFSNTSQGFFRFSVQELTFRSDFFAVFFRGMLTNKFKLSLKIQFHY